MKKLFRFLVVLGVLFGTGMAQKPAAPGSSLPARLNGKPSSIRIDYGSIPLYFTANEGQVDGRVRFYAKASRYTLWLTQEGLVFDSFKTDQSAVPDRETGPAVPLDRLEARSFQRDVSRLVFLRANKDFQVVPVDETALKVNYFIGDDPAKWRTVPTSAAVLCKNIYDRIDLKVYGTEGRIEYDWIVRPGGNPADIRFEYRNVKTTRIDDDGNLLVETDFGELMHKRPEAYQEVEEPASAIPAAKESWIPVESGFENIEANTYEFKVGDYDSGRNLMIDPIVLAYSTYLGGSDQDYGTGIAVDGGGNAYISGYTVSADFPALNQYQADQAGVDAFVAKIDTTKSGSASLVYSTYLGGSSYDYGWGIAVDGGGNAYVTGSTCSADFPTLNPYQTYKAGMDAFVTRIDTSKSGAASLVYSTCLGSVSGDEGRGIAVDGSGNAYITGETNAGDFPTLNPNWGWAGDSDAFVTKIDTTKSGAASLVYSTYLGGNYNDKGAAIAVDGAGNAYITGQTYSPYFPARNQYQADQGGADAFMARIDTTKSGYATLVYSTYLGGGNEDRGTGIAVDGGGIAYITGYTSSADFPVLNQYQTDQGDYDSFITKIDTTKSGSASLVYSTYLGGSSYDYSWSIAVDGGGKAYVTGVTTSSNFPVLNQLQTVQGGNDVFVTKIDTMKSGSDGLVYSTYVAGSYFDMGHGIAVDAAGNAYLAGETSSADFPVLNQYQTYPGNYNGFILKLTANADLNLTKTSDNLSPKIGETFHYTVTATNNGPFEATGLQVTDLLPAGILYQSSTPSQGSYAVGTGIWDIGTLANGASAALTLTVAGIEAGSIANTASVSSLKEPDPNVENDSASVTVTIIPLYALTIMADLGGTTDPIPGTYTHDAGTTVAVKAVPSPSSEFAGWTGDASGLINPITIVMSRDKTIRATFARAVKSPLSLTGQKLANRNVSSVEYVAKLAWQANGANPEPVTYRIYKIEFGPPGLIGQTGAGVTEFILRNLEKSKTYVFGVAAVNSQGWESDMAQVVVQ